MLNTLHLINFMRHEELELSFSPQETLIVGDNWAGKTTVFKAILYAFFGSASVPGGAKVIQRRGTKTKPAVTLSFSVGSDNYTVIRKLTTAKLLKGSKLVATGPANVTSAMEDLLGMPAKLFGELRTSPQDEVSAILTIGVGRLNQIIGQITKAELIETIQKLLRARQQQIVAQLGVLPEYDLPSLRADITKATDKLNNQYVELEQAKIELAANHEDIQTASTFLAELNDKVKEHYVAQALQSETKAHIQSLTDRLGEAETGMETPVQNTAELQKTWLSISQAVQQLSNSITEKNTHEAMLRQLKTDKELETNHLSQLRTELQAMGKLPTAKSVAAQMTKLIKMRGVAGELKERAKVCHAAAESSICPTCMRPFESSDVMEAAIKSAEEAKENYDSYSAAVYEEEQLLESLSEKKKKHGQILDRTERSEQSMTELETRIHASENAVQKLHLDGSLPELEKQAADAHAALSSARLAESKYLQAVEKANQLRPQLKQEKEKLAKISLPGCPTRRELGIANEQVHALTNTHRETTGLVTSLAAAYAAAYQDYTRQKADFDLAERANKDRWREQRKTNNLANLGIYLSKAHKDFIDRTWSNILTYTSEFVSRCTGGTISKLSVVEGSKFFYEEDGKKLPIASASGFQRACMGVGVRLALAEAIRSPVGVSLLDEVTAGATDENSMAMAQALSQAGQQVVIISHRQADAAVADRVIQL